LWVKLLFSARYPTIPAITTVPIIVGNMVSSPL
jgi:hypothetical protein